MSRVRVVVGVVAMVAVALSIAGFTFRSRADRPSPAVDTLAVLSEHLGYEGALIDGVLHRLAPADARVASDVRDLTSSQGAQLALALQRRGYSAAAARALWQRVIGDGAPAPSRVLLYVCSVHALQSDQSELVDTPAGSAAAALGDIELTLLVEGRQLASQLGGPIGAAVDNSQRDALHLLAPLLIPTDRAFAENA
jgi:hypothetical protein